MVSIPPQIFQLSRSIFQFGLFQGSMIRITVTFIFYYIFFSLRSLARAWYGFCFLLSPNLCHLLEWWADKFFFSYYLKQNLIFWFGLSDPFLSQNQRNLWVSFFRTVPVSVYTTICLRSKFSLHEYLWITFHTQSCIIIIIIIESNIDELIVSSLNLHYI